MADNIDEEHLDTPTNTQLENSSAEFVPTTDTETINTNQETDIMEVHKHPHHVTHKKKWGEYIIEFIMLFLAVFLGFLAENYREHQVEKERGKQYVESFYRDLRTDTGRMSYYTNFDDVKLNVLKNLPDYYDSVSTNPKGTYILDIIKVSAFNRPFKLTERTLNQLFNAGGFRLLSKEDADSIVAYQKEFNNFEDFQETAFQEAQNNIRATFNQLINFSANAQMFQTLGILMNPTFENKNVTAPVLFSNDKALVNKYFNELELYYRVTYNHRGILERLKSNQIRLIKYFEDKYDFKKDHN